MLTIRRLSHETHGSATRNDCRQRLSPYVEPNPIARPWHPRLACTKRPRQCTSCAMHACLAVLPCAPPAPRICSRLLASTASRSCVPTRAAYSLSLCRTRRRSTLGVSEALSNSSCVCLSAAAQNSVMLARRQVPVLQLLAVDSEDRRCRAILMSWSVLTRSVGFKLSYPLHITNPGIHK